MYLTSSEFASHCNMRVGKMETWQDVAQPVQETNHQILVIYLNLKIVKRSKISAKDFIGKLFCFLNKSRTSNLNGMAKKETYLYHTMTLHMRNRKFAVLTKLDYNGEQNFFVVEFSLDLD